MDEVFEILIRIVIWPFRIWKESNENSAIGASNIEHSAIKVWAAVAIGGIALLSLIAIVYWIFF